MCQRKWLPNFADLIDRLTIHQLKEVLLPQLKSKYSSEMELLCWDIDQIVGEKQVLISSRLVQAIVALAQINAHIWYNESKARQGQEQDLSLLKLTHGLNGIRNRICNYILKEIGQEEKSDPKTDCLAAEFKDWDISFLSRG